MCSRMSWTVSIFLGTYRLVEKARIKGLLDYDSIASHLFLKRRIQIPYTMNSIFRLLQ